MEETIAAVSTAYGEGGIGIVRMSGESAKDVLDSLFCRVSDNIADSSVNDSLAAKKIIRNIPNLNPCGIFSKSKLPIFIF